MMDQLTNLRGTALVAGGAGFLGSHLCDRLLEQGLKVICLDSLLTGAMRNIAHLKGHPHFRFLKHDICEPVQVNEKLDLVYNLACPASPPRYQADPIHTMMTSVSGTLNLLTLAEANGARFLQASTSEVYGDPDMHPQSEDYHGNVSCTGLRACYDEGKRAAEALCFDMLRANRADVRVARIFNTYGPRMDPEDGRIVSNFVVQALRGEPMTVYGTGEQTRSFCYVSDLVAGLMALMDVADNPGVPVNVGNPGEFTINQLAELVVAQTRTASKTVFKPLPEDDPTRRRPDISRAKALLGWEPTVPLEKGLGDTIAYFRERLAAEKVPASAREMEMAAQ
jgi:UDP-glucuronate decarboxylase